MKKSLAGSIMLLIALAACNQAAIDSKAEGEKVMQVSRDWSRVAGTDSLEKILSYWADDAIVMPPGQIFKGKAAIRQMLMETAKVPGFVNDAAGKPVTQYNKDVTIWRKESDGSWKNIVDTWNEGSVETK